MSYFSHINELVYGVWLYENVNNSSYIKIEEGQSSKQARFILRQCEDSKLEVELYKQISPNIKVLFGISSFPSKLLKASSRNYFSLEVFDMRKLDHVVATITLFIDSGTSISVNKDVIPSTKSYFNTIGKQKISKSSSSLSINSAGTLDFEQSFTLSGNPVSRVTASSDSASIMNVSGESSLMELCHPIQSPMAPPDLDTEQILRGRRSPVQVHGLITLEIISAHNLPLSKRLFRLSGLINPFTVISFGKKTYKTKVLKSSCDPVWKQTLYFTVNESESHYQIGFSIYDHHKLSVNALIGSVSLDASHMCDHMDEIVKFALPLNCPDGKVSDAVLLIKGCFISFDVLRQNFWRTLAQIYDQDENGRLNKLEFTSMMESAGSTISNENLEDLMNSLDVDVEGKVEIENIVVALEMLTVKNERAGVQSLVSISRCPVCLKSFKDKGKHEIDIISHLSICTLKDSSKIKDRLVMGGFITEEYASRKWFTRFIGYIGFGGYGLGKRNGNILVQDRRSGKVQEEKIPTYIRIAIRSMYGRGRKLTVDTSMARQIFQSMTIKQGLKYNHPSSSKYIADFVRYHKIPIEEALEPIGSFSTFNEFFYRKLKPGARVLENKNEHFLCSPADCRLTCFSTISDATHLWIKGERFTIETLLDSSRMAKKLDGGSLFISRLAPQDYHRFHSPVAGRITKIVHHPGTYFTVNPMAVRQNIDVYTENTRTSIIIDSPIFGLVAYVAIGAMMVGSVVITKGEGDLVSRMDEIGYFAFGGSTIVVVLPKNRVIFDDDLLYNSREQIEMLVRVGDTIGFCPIEV